ncbi:TPA: GNAT family N-acetyltransferase [Streptococcus suis]|nr:GNAT family N-acetyltransferase [Streptococcus suis]MCQ8264887.1 GNAT family N-acetyltransferase [Streptococcus suis]
MTIWTNLAAFAEFETSRLQFRPFCYDDLDAFFQIVSSPDNLTFIFPSISDKKEAADFLVSQFMKAPLGIWALEDRKSGQLIGAIRLEKLNEQSKQAEIGYFLKKDYWRQGLMTEALKNLVYLSFYHLGIKRLLLKTHLENIASQRVAQKAGFQLLNQYRGSDRYSRKTRNYLLFGLDKHTFNLSKYEENE